MDRVRVAGVRVLELADALMREGVGVTVVVPFAVGVGGDRLVVWVQVRVGVGEGVAVGREGVWEPEGLRERVAERVPVKVMVGGDGVQVLVHVAVQDGGVGVWEVLRDSVRDDTVQVRVGVAEVVPLGRAVGDVVAVGSVFVRLSDGVAVALAGLAVDKVGV